MAYFTSFELEIFTQKNKWLCTKPKPIYQQFLYAVSFLANVNLCSRSLYVVVRPSVICLSVTFVHPTQPIAIFGNVSAQFNTLVT